MKTEIGFADSCEHSKQAPTRSTQIRPNFCCIFEDMSVQFNYFETRTVLPDDEFELYSHGDNSKGKN